MSRDAPFKSELLTIEDDLAQAVTRHPIITLKGFSRFRVPGGELMHNGALGTVQYYVGGVLTDFIFGSDLPGDEPSDNLQFLWEEIQAEYSRQNIKTRLTQLTLPMFSLCK